MKTLDTIETERLTGRRIQSGDFDLLCRLLQDPIVAATLGGVRSDEEVHQFLAKSHRTKPILIWLLRRGQYAVLLCF